MFYQKIEKSTFWCSKDNESKEQDMMSKLGFDRYNHTDTDTDTDMVWVHHTDTYTDTDMVLLNHIHTDTDTNIERKNLF